ncbi:DUF6893 family small protein [Streptomyces montanus]|nr:hypothetical protein [Streptomyces montanus]
MKHHRQQTMKASNIIGGAAAATALAAMVKAFMPDLRRYLRIRRM